MMAVRVISSIPWEKKVFVLLIELYLWTDYECDAWASLPLKPGELENKLSNLADNVEFSARAIHMWM